MKQRHGPFSSSGLSRRAAIGSAGAIAGVLGLGSRIGHTSAQDATPNAMASHPIVGTWMVTTPAGLAMAVFFADGTNIQGLPATMASPMGVTYVSTQVGTWEPTGPRSVHFTGVQLHTDANGTLVATVTIDAHPTVSEDGQTFRNDNPESGPTIRDAAGTIIDVPRGAPPATGVRMGVGSPGLPGVASMAGTPTA